MSTSIFEIVVKRILYQEKIRQMNGTIELYNKLINSRNIEIAKEILNMFTCDHCKEIQIADNDIPAFLVQKIQKFGKEVDQFHVILNETYREYDKYMQKKAVQ